MGEGRKKMQLLKKRGLCSALYALLAVLLAAVFLLCAACASEDAGGRYL